jgi:hypothetical protein
MQKREWVTVKIEKANYSRLVSIKGFLEQKYRQPFSLNDVIETLLDLYDIHGGEHFASTMQELGYTYAPKKKT